MENTKSLLSIGEWTRVLNNAAFEALFGGDALIVWKQVQRGC